MTDHGAARGESGPEPPPSAAEDTRFRHAVAAIDAGEAEVLRQLIDEHPALVTHRLVSPGPWLREQVGIPVLTGLPFGHVPTKVTMPVGARVQLLVQGRDVLIGW